MQDTQEALEEGLRNEEDDDPALKGHDFTRLCYEIGKT